MSYRIKETKTGLYVSLENSSFILSSKEKSKLFISKSTRSFEHYCGILNQLKCGVWVTAIGFFLTKETDLYKEIASGNHHFTLSKHNITRDMIKNYGDLDYYIPSYNNRSWVNELEFIIEDGISQAIDCWIARDSDNSISLYPDVPVLNEDTGMYKSILGFLMLPDNSFSDITFESGPEKVTVMIKRES